MQSKFTVMRRKEYAGICRPRVLRPWDSLEHLFEVGRHSQDPKRLPSSTIMKRGVKGDISVAAGRALILKK